MRSFWLKIPAIVYSLIIFTLSSLPQEKVPAIEIWNFDKVLHLIEYTIYGIFLSLAFASAEHEKVARRAIPLSLLTGLLFAITDELHQYFVPGRFCSIYDWLADAIGIGLGIYLFHKIKLFRAWISYEFEQS